MQTVQEVTTDTRAAEAVAAAERALAGVPTADFYDLLGQRERLRSAEETAADRHTRAEEATIDAKRRLAAVMLKAELSVPTPPLLVVKPAGPVTYEHEGSTVTLTMEPFVLSRHDMIETRFADNEQKREAMLAVLNDFNAAKQAAARAAAPEYFAAENEENEAEDAWCEVREQRYELFRSAIQFPTTDTRIMAEKVRLLVEEEHPEFGPAGDGSYRYEGNAAVGAVFTDVIRLAQSPFHVELTPEELVQWLQRRGCEITAEGIYRSQAGFTLEVGRVLGALTDEQGRQLLAAARAPADEPPATPESLAATWPDLEWPVWSAEGQPDDKDWDGQATAVQWAWHLLTKDKPCLLEFTREHLSSKQDVPVPRMVEIFQGASDWLRGLAIVTDTAVARVLAATSLVVCEDDGQPAFLHAAE